ncbi:DUF1788 domain-containing protein [Flagellimonas alvinocaridis]|uniref:DUF1788 domain-containing protein n=1 Tax=Flagellimonas alvinocaridis TaxID=2530200 RepID=A0A4S8RZD6_9FLAO|nr:DUF1788 domain-containing protein [Allomuricauda alvinocaridis]THV60829.1 DUF1788 domain-containing protein [Allomuricauda alvinocaridis]
MSNLTQKFEHLFKVISSSNFLNKESLGGEIPFFISAYDCKEEIACRDEIRLLIRKLEDNGVHVLELNLYSLTCEILEDKGGMERMFKVEQAKPKDKFLNALQSSLNMHQVLMPLIKEKIKAANAKVYFLTGIGLVFPFIRSHNVLNNLQNIAKEAPTVAFFPGDYNGHTLNLFGMLKDDNYYRAFNMDKIEAKL